MAGLCVMSDYKATRNKDKMPSFEDAFADSFIGKLYMMPRVDMTSADSVQDRIEEYFDLCWEYRERPGMTALALALGINRRTLLYYVQGKYSGVKYDNAAVIRALKKAHGLIEAWLEAALMNDFIPPANGIFLLKNGFGYKDRCDLILAPVEDSCIISPSALESRLAALAE